jgi:hypothetical protein
MRSKSAFFLFMAWQIFNFNMSFAQIGPVMPSPNATSLGMYSELPVSYFTGVPNISIPVYELKGNKIGLPLSFSYHAGGLRPDVHPSWVGNGWNLNAGGAITRKVNSGYDETPLSGFYAAYNYLNRSNWSSDAQIKSQRLYRGLYPNKRSTVLKRKDVRCRNEA